MNKDIIRKIMTDILSELEMLEIQEGFWYSQNLKNQTSEALNNLGQIQNRQKFLKSYFEYLKEKSDEK
jgi:hypothetical protein